MSRTTRYPARLCAICSNPSPLGHLCKNCLREWGDVLKSKEPWLMEMISASNHDYYMRKKELKYRRVPIEKVPI